MLSKPNAGWTIINLANVNIHGSYLTDIPLDFIEALSEVLTTNTYKTIVVDAESNGEYIYVIGPYSTYIIEEYSNEGKPKLYLEEKRALDLAKELANDIKSNMDLWLTWNPSLDYDDMDESEKLEYNNEIEKRKDIFESFIQKYK